MSEQVTEKATKAKTLVDAYVRAEFHRPWGWNRLTEEERAEALEEQCRDYKSFIRDHRSQDLTDLEVIREYQDQCSACGGSWDTMDDENGVEICGNCGAEVEK